MTALSSNRTMVPSDLCIEGEFITEKSELKIGLYSPGQHIPIVADEKLFETQPDYALILAWNFAEEIMENLKNYLKAGGKFIIPIPKPHILG